MDRVREITGVEQEILLEGLEDYIGLWEVIAAVREELPEKEKPLIRRSVMEIISNLLKRGLMRAGVPTRDGGFTASDEGIDELLARIECEWDELGREPDVWDIIWFDITEKGKEASRLNQI